MTRLSIDEMTELVATDVTGPGPMEEERAELDEYTASGVLGVA
jgi:hypothetical protein